jgi:vacuolar protein sorting-associated protein 3
LFVKLTSELQLDHHCSALAILAHELHDYTTAEAYCMLGGTVVPGKTVQSIVESDAGLELWAFAVCGAAKPTSQSALQHNQMYSDGKLKKELLKKLLGVYMNGR